MKALTNQEHTLIIEIYALLNVVLVKTAKLEELRPMLQKLSGQVAPAATAEPDEHEQHLGATATPPRLVTVDGLPQYQLPAITPPPAPAPTHDETYPADDFDWMDIAIATLANH